MKLNLANAPYQVIEDDSPAVGDIFRKAGGQPGFWWIISTKPNGDCIVIAFDVSGNPTGACRYGLSYFAKNDHRRVGRADVPSIDPEWF